MTLSFCSFSSGSSGNCYLVKSERTAILVDAGISGKRIIAGLSKTKTPVEQLTAILITHEHVDHVSGVSVALNKFKDITIHSNRKTFSKMDLKSQRERTRIFQNGDSFTIGDLDIETFSLNHDAVDTVGYNIRHENKQISIVTDTGVLDEKIMSKLTDSDILVIEANHDEQMLRSGSYPPYLKRRILGNEGHLSNDKTGHYIADIMEKKEKARCVLLAHLSRDNNDPETAEQTVINILEENNWENGRDVYVKSIKRDEISMIYEI